MSYFPTAANWTFGAPPQRLGPSYSFSIRSPGSHRGWSFAASDTFARLRSAAGRAERAARASARPSPSKKRHGLEREFRRLYRQAIVVVHKAERHEAISGENLFSARQGRFSSAGTGT